MKLSTQLRASLAVAASMLTLGLAQNAQAEVQLAEVDDWKVSTDGRVNAFVSHIWGENRPLGKGLFPWIAFNEADRTTVVTADGELGKTRVRSGYVPTFFAINVKKQVSENLRVSTRVELGIQIANQKPTEIADPTWMEPRAVYLDVAGTWGSVRAGRDLGLFGRGNLLLNFELGHNYGVGFPCSYTVMYGGACGHVTFGAIWPDFKAQVTYTTPKIADMVSLSVGVFDPRTLPPFDYEQTPLPRFESELNFDTSWDEGWGVKAWANAFWQQVGTTTPVGQVDALGNPIVDDVGNPVTELTDFAVDAYGVGGGVQGNFGSLKLGGAAYMGQGIGTGVILTFNPIVANQIDEDAIDLRPSQAFLLQASYALGDSWLSLGFGKTMMDRLETDGETTEVDAGVVLRSQTGISAGLFHRLGNVVLGLDYFNANYAFDDRLITNPDAAAAATVPTIVDETSQQMHTINGGITAEW